MTPRSSSPGTVVATDAESAFGALTVRRATRPRSWPSFRASLAPSLMAFSGISPLERLEMDGLLEALYRHYGYDLRSYAPSSLRSAHDTERDGAADRAELVRRTTS